jgi:hypothetical protein
MLYSAFKKRPIFLLMALRDNRVWEEGRESAVPYLRSEAAHPSL